MGSIKKAKKEAVALLAVAKKAFKFIRDNPAGLDSERDALLEELGEVIDRADPPVVDESLTSVNLVMTNATAKAIRKILEERSSLSAEDESLLEAFKRGLRVTQQRTYLRFDLDFTVLRRLHYVLRHSRPRHPAQVKSFNRLADRIEQDALNKNPMQIIGEMGL